MFAPGNHRRYLHRGVRGDLAAADAAGLRELAAGPGCGVAARADPDPAGGRVVTYDGWPLYTYAGDVEPGRPPARTSTSTAAT